MTSDIYGYDIDEEPEDDSGPIVLKKRSQNSLLNINTHDFESAKNKIKKFSNETLKNLELQRVEEEVLWFFDHDVTGKELNELTSQIQGHLHSINNTQIKMIKEFGEVYRALEALDKDYIRGILISIKETEKTSESLRKQQEQIKKSLNNQKKILAGLVAVNKKTDEFVQSADLNKANGSFGGPNLIELSYAIKSLARKIKYAYWLAGGAIGLAIVAMGELFFILW